VTHPLDNPVWASLTGDHAALARVDGSAGRYPADVAPFVAVDAYDADTERRLAGLVAPGETVCLVGRAPPWSAAWSHESPVPISQMLCRERLAVVDGPEVVPLDDSNRDDMLALTARVYPFYFRARTNALGPYIGIYDGDVLAAMAGRRMAFDGYQELSAICTHPDYLGRRYAQRLVAILSNAILDEGRQPFLHVSHQNRRAQGLYQRIGFRHRAHIPLWSLTRAGLAHGA
jgi:ribosomal protein S18 acetylase RimI-like enzyme